MRPARVGKAPRAKGVIIQLRGTGGSGKSTLAKKVMERYQSSVQVFEEGRKRPIGYVCRDGPNKRPLFVVGHYETACGGADTITSVEKVYGLVKRYADDHDVLFEGIIPGDDVTRTAGLHLDKYPIVVIGLDVPIEVCLSSIEGRRAERGDARPLNPFNTVNRAKRLKQNMSRLKLSNVRTVWLDRAAAEAFIVSELGL